MYADDPDRTKYSYSPPTELDYYDNKGSVGLLGCRSGPATQRFGGSAPGTGVGAINARFAIEGAWLASNYLKLNGFRSEIDGLSQWLGYSALRTFIKLPKDGVSHQITTTATAVEDLPLSRALNLRAVAHAFSTGLQSPEVTFRSRVFLQTFTKSARDWDDHLPLHVGVRDLLRIAAWQPINFNSHQAASLKETVTVKEEEKQTWREVRTAVTGLSEPSWKVTDRFLFAYNDIGRPGVSRWMKLAETYARGIKPLIRILDLKGATIDAHVMQLGIAVEAIGYQSLIESGMAPATANRKPVKERVDHLLIEVAGAIRFSPASFAQDFADSYNSVKHANRAPVTPAVKLEHYRHGVEMLRAWVAIQIGVSKTVVNSRW